MSHTNACKHRKWKEPSRNSANTICNSYLDTRMKHITSKTATSRKRFQLNSFYSADGLSKIRGVYIRLNHIHNAKNKNQNHIQ